VIGGALLNSRVGFREFAFPNLDALDYNLIQHTKPGDLS